jgi:hypothetical protein
MQNRQKALHEAVLGKDLTDIGFTLEEDEDFAYLWFKDSLLHRYNAKSVTVERLRLDANDALRAYGGESGQGRAYQTAS